MDYTTHKHPVDEHKYLILDHSTEKATAVTLLSHWLYIRLCERAEELDGILLPQKSRDEHNTLYEVIAVGRDVRRHREITQRYRNVPDMQCNAILDIAVGDTIIIPEKATADSSGYEGFVKRSTVSEYEGMIDKGLVLAVVK